MLVPPRPGENQKAPGRLVGCPRSGPSSVICWTHHVPSTSPQDPAPSAGNWEMMRLHPEPSSKGCMESQHPVKQWDSPLHAIRANRTPTSRFPCVCVCVCARLVTQSCPTLCNLMGCQAPLSMEILQARIPMKLCKILTAL